MSPIEDIFATRLGGPARISWNSVTCAATRSGTPLGESRCRRPSGRQQGETVMNPIAAGVAGALISGMAVYTMGAKAAQVDAFTPTAAPVQTVGAQFVPAANYSTALRPIATPAITQSIDTPRPTVVSTRRAPARQRSIDRAVVNEDRVPVREGAGRPGHSWAKTAMIIGGSAAGGAGVGGIVGGKKGAMVGAAIGGGAASIFEATRRD